MAHQIGVFISHSWTHPAHYNDLADWLFKGLPKVDGEVIKFANHSVPRDAEIHGTDDNAELGRAIENKIKKSHVVVVPTAGYSQRRKWIKREIVSAGKLKRPILGVNPPGHGGGSQLVGDVAEKIVKGWNAQSVRRGILVLYEKQRARKR